MWYANLVKCQQNESCIELYQLLLPVHQRSRNYNKQAECYKDLYKMCRIVVDENQNKQKLYSNYYRVAFYGPKLEELDDTEWVYKESSAVRLADVSDKLKVSNTHSQFLFTNVRLSTRADMDQTRCIFYPTQNQ